MRMRYALKQACIAGLFAGCITPLIVGVFSSLYTPLKDIFWEVPLLSLMAIGAWKL